MLDAFEGVSRTSLLRLLLGTPLANDMPPLLDGPALDQLLHWSTTQPPGVLVLRDAPITASVRDALSGRLDQLRLMLATWAETGVWVIGRDDPGFPRRLRRRMGGETPALVFGSGDRALFGRGGVALVGGGDAWAPEGLPAMRDALDRAGMAVIECSGDAISVRRDTPRAETVLRLTPPGIACGDRAALLNCCHAIADAVVVWDLSRGDPSWAAVVASIARDQPPVWTRNTEGDPALLIRAGARPLPPDLLNGNVAALLRPSPGPQARRLLQDARAPWSGEPDRSVTTPPEFGPMLVRGFAETQAGFGDATRDTAGPVARAPFLRLVDTGATMRRQAPPAAAGGQTLFEMFVERLDRLLVQGPLGGGRIAEAMDLTRTQVDAWLLRAEAAGTVSADTQTGLYARVERRD